MSAIPGIANAHARVAQIESQLGVRRPPAAPAQAASPVDFDDLLAQVTGTDSPAASSRSAAAGLPLAMERLAAVGRPGSPSSTRPGITDLEPLFEAAGLRHGVDPALLKAVAQTESGFDPRAVSHAGAQGLMQLMPATAEGLGVTDPFDPEQAVDGAARLLKGHIDRFGSVELALAAYNAGPGAVQRFGGVPPYGETQRYIPKVLANYEEHAR